MISHTTLGTNNLETAAAFYDALLADLGGKRHLETERAVIWRLGESPTMLGVSIPFNGEPATIGNGSMVAFAVDSPAQVDALHEKPWHWAAPMKGIPANVWKVCIMAPIFAIRMATRSACSISIKPHRINRTTSRYA